MKKGRPTNINQAKNRVHSVVLSVMAESIYREHCKVRNNKKWFHEFVNKRLIDEFEKGDHTENVLIAEIYQLQEERDRMDKKVQAKAAELMKHRGQKQERRQ